MKYLSTVLIMLLASVTTLYGGAIVLEGKYQQKNVYVVNSVAEAGVGFCVYEVTVNGEVSSDEINSHAFEVDLSIYGFKLGDDVIIQIKYKDGCEPRVLNPGALEPQPTFEVVNIEVSDSGLLSWETTNEQGQLPFQIQQFKWSKWVNIGEVNGKGTSTRNTYTFQTSSTSGENKFRVVQKSYEGKLRKSPSVQYISSIEPINFSYDKKEKAIFFTAETSYELYNVYGQIIKRGFGKKVKMSNLPKNEYYISFDSTTQKFERK